MKGEELLDSIYTICQELNSPSSNYLAESSFWGSRLALDILTENVADTNPRYKRLFVECALRLVESLDFESHQKLASIYNSSVSQSFKKSILIDWDTVNFQNS